jgi:hypothetical protein
MVSEITETIITQMGGVGRLVKFTGAYNFIDHGNGLSFKFDNVTDKKINYCKVTYDEGEDLYNLEFGFIRGLNYKKVKEMEGIYFDQLIDIFEEETRMYLTLFPRKKAEEF